MLRTGLPALDAPWGGLTPGESYLLVGRLGAGRAALALQIARAVADASRCLYLSTRTPQALAQSAAQAGYDLAAAYRDGRMRLMQIPPAAELAAGGSDGLDDAYADLIALVGEERPAAVVVEDFTPLVQFDAFERFEAAFSGLREALRTQGVALVLGLGEPANDASRQLLALLSRRVDGTIRLEVLDGGARRLVLSRRDAPPAVSTPPKASPEAATAPAEAAPAHTPEPPPVPSADFGSQNDGAASGLPHPSLAAPDPFAEATNAPAPKGPFGPDTFAHDPITMPAGPQPARILPAPAPDPSLLLSGTDPFAEESTRSLVDQGYLIDSREQPAAPAEHEEPFAAEPAAPPPVSSEPVSSEPFGAERGAPEEPVPSARRSEGAFAQALDAAFAQRLAQSTPFLVVALRMEPDSLQAAHFPLVVEGVCDGPHRECLADETRCRAVVLLPGAGPEAAQALFGTLQTHLYERLGDFAGEALRAVGAVTLPNGEPFTDAQALLAYAYGS